MCFGMGCCALQGLCGAFSMCCRVGCSGVSRDGDQFSGAALSRSGRIMSIVVFILYALFAMTSDWIGMGANRWYPYPIDSACDTDCYRYYNIGRMMIPLMLYHLVQALLLIAVRDTDNVRSIIQNGFWFIKIPFLFIAGLIAFEMPYEYVDRFYYVAVVLGTVYLIIQAVLLVDSAYAWAEELVEQMEDGQDWAKWVLLSSTIIMNLVVYVGVGFLYYYYTSDLEKTLITLALLSVIAMTVCSVLPSVQETNPSAGVFQSSFLGMYVFFVVLTALSSEPSSAISNLQLPTPDPENPTPLQTMQQMIKQQVARFLNPMAQGVVFGGGSSSANSSISMANFLTVSWMVPLVRYGSLIFLLISLVRGALCIGNGIFGSSGSMIKSAEDVEKNMMGEGDGLGAVDDGEEYNYSNLHFGFVLATAFLFLSLTLWKRAEVINDAVVIFVNGSLAYWMRLASSWIISLLYIWSLFAPMILEDRDFY